MTIAAWLATATGRLSAASITTARLDALVLLEDCLSRDRALLLAHPDTALTPQQLQLLAIQVARRLTHEPLAYIRGKAEFYGRTFSVNSNVLVPRPESETIITILGTLPSTGNQTIVDVGSGSGALAITTKLERPAARIIGVDIDPACLAIAGRNANELGAEVYWLQGDLLTPIIDANIVATILLCNLPYVPTDFPLNQAASHEPKLALFGGQDGLGLYRRLFEQLKQFEPSLAKPAYIITEALPSQHKALAFLAEAVGYSCQQTGDFIQLYGLKAGLPSPVR